MTFKAFSMCTLVMICLPNAVLAARTPPVVNDSLNAPLLEVAKRLNPIRHSGVETPCIGKNDESFSSSKCFFTTSHGRSPQ